MENKEIEVWKTIPEFESYQASSLGNIKSIDRLSKHKRTPNLIIKGKNRKFTTSKYGYFRLNLNGKTISVHILCAMAFKNHKNTKGLHVDHINNNKKDNRIINLQVITNRLNSSKDRKRQYSKYVGVTWDKSRNKWKAAIEVNSRCKHLGHFTSAEETGLAYQNYARTVHGDFYRAN